MLIVILVQLVIIIYIVKLNIILEEEKKEIEKNKHKYDDINYKNLVDKMNLKKECNILNKELELYKHIDNENLKKGISTINEKKLQIKPIFETKKLLLGDYNLEMLNHSRKIFISLGFEVDTVQTGMDLINRIALNNNYDVIVTNNLYKDSYDGEEILSELKELENFNIPVVVLTSSIEKEKIFLEKGFNGYLEKVLTQEQAETLMVEILKMK